MHLGEVLTKTCEICKREFTTVSPLRKQCRKKECREESKKQKP